MGAALVGATTQGSIDHDQPPGDQAEPPTSGDRKGADPAPENLEEQDRQGNTKQNATNQGYQQDR